MPALSTPADLRAWVEARAPGRSADESRPTGSADRWLEAAAALRLAALEVPGVATLSDSATFQTRGRGPAVVGVALAPQLDGGARADVAVVLETSAAAEPGRLAAVARAVGQAVRATWQRLGDPRPLTVRVHVVDLADGARP